MTPQKILIVEDTKRVLDILAFAIGREGYQIIKARDGLTGIFLAKEQMPDLIILDLDSPLSKEISALDTFEVCCDLREEGIAAPILVLIKEEKQKEVMLRAGADDFIIKPFAMRELLHHVWGYTGFAGDIRAVDVSIRRLREKIEDDPAKPAVIVTRRGCGYLFAI